VRHYAFPPKFGFELATESGVPRGSGLGGSSALGVAVHAVLRRALGKPLGLRERLVREAQLLECRVIGAPTGVQDFYPALYGGVQALWYRDGAVERETLPAGSAEFLESSLILAYTGQSRLSASTNWRVFKNAFEDRGRARKRLRAIGEAALKAREAVLQKDVTLLAEAVSEEWLARRGLAAGIETAAMRRLIAAAKRAGALAAKACGAGGGGCVMFVAREKARPDVERALRRAGARVMAVRIPARGLRVRRVIGS